MRTASNPGAGCHVYGELTQESCSPSKMSDLFGTQTSPVLGAGLSTRQKVALTVLVGIAIAVVIIRWLRTAPTDTVFLGPKNVGTGELTSPDTVWMQLMTADQIAKTTGNNMTCSFFVYVNHANVSKLPIRVSEPAQAAYLLTIGNTLGVIMDPLHQTCIVDILQSPPHSPKGDTIAFKAGLRQILRSMTVKGVLVSKWNQITITVEGRSIDVYVNGKLVNSAVMDNVPISLFSGILLNESPDFEGQVCLFQMWSHRRSSQQILENYKGHVDLRGKPDIPDPELTLSGAWERFMKASCDKVGFCGFPVQVGPMEFVEYEFA